MSGAETAISTQDSDIVADNVAIRPNTSVDICGELTNNVVGQESAKRQLSTLLAMHLHWFVGHDLSHAAPNALLIGPTGVGKTHAIGTAAKILNIPLVVVDATRLFPFGDQGPSLDGVLFELISAARRLINEQRVARSANNGDSELSELDELEVARRGIIFIDEFDKLVDQSDSSSSRNQLLQRRLLQFIDGATISLNPLPRAGEEEIIFQTAGLLFVAAGAFTNLKKQAGPRSQNAMRDLNVNTGVTFEDLVHFGFMQELIARFPVKIEFGELTAADLEDILTNRAVDPTLFYTRYIKSLGTDVEVTKEARALIAQQALRFGVGARGLHQILFPMLTALSHEIEDKPRPHFCLDVDEVVRLTDKISGGFK